MKVLEHKEFCEFESKVVRVANTLYPEWGGNFSGAKLDPIRKDLAQKLYQVDKVYLKGEEPSDSVTAKETVVETTPIVVEINNDVRTWEDVEPLTSKTEFVAKVLKAKKVRPLIPKKGKKNEKNVL